MKICQVYGDMTSEKSSENYPTDVFCDECFSELDRGEESQVVTHSEYDSSWPGECSKCGKTLQEEKEEQVE